MISLLDVAPKTTKITVLYFRYEFDFKIRLLNIAMLNNDLPMFAPLFL